MAVLVVVILFVVIGALISVFGYLHYVRPTRLLDQLTNSSSDVIPTRLRPKQMKSGRAMARFLEPVGNLLPISPQDSAALRDELISAGIRSRSAVAVFHGIKLILSVTFVLLALVFRADANGPILRLMAPVLGGFVGYMLPGFILRKLIKRRSERIRLSLPDVLDLLVICTEAGCGLDQALVNVSRELKKVHPAVSEEISLLNMEIMAGKSRADALRNFARRAGEDEARKLVAILIQTDRFGTSVSDALRTQSDYLRIRRRNEAEERAGKVGVKLVFPIFFFCMPSLLVVTAGSGLLQLFHNLFPAMNGFQ